MCYQTCYNHLLFSCDRRDKLMKGDAICGHCYFLADRHIIMAIGVSLPNGDKRRKWGFGWGHGLLVFPTWVTTTVLAAFVSFLRLKGTVMPRYFRLKPFEDLGSNELSLSLSRQVLLPNMMLSTNHLLCNFESQTSGMVWLCSWHCGSNIKTG